MLSGTSDNPFSLLVNNGGLQVAGGTLDGSGFGLIGAGSAALLDLSGNVINTASTSLTVAANSLLIVPSGFNPASYKSYSNFGLTDTLGTTLSVSAGTGFAGWGMVPNRVVCQGTITAIAGGWINLAGGLALSGSGQANLGSGTLTVNDSGFSAITSGSLTANMMVLGLSSTANFTQSGGTNTAGTLVLGSLPSSAGAYALNGGLLRVSNLRHGSGTAEFDASGGTLQAAASFSSNVSLVLASTGTNAVFDTSGNTLTLLGGISGNGGLKKSGAGVLVLGGTNTYSGGTTINSGKLIVLGALALESGSNLAVGFNASIFSADIVPSSEASFVAADPSTRSAGARACPAGLSDPQPVPEPGSLVSFAAGAILLGLYRRWAVEPRCKTAGNRESR